MTGNATLELEMKMRVRPEAETSHLEDNSRPPHWKAAASFLSLFLE
jgi:hypothetical protein